METEFLFEMAADLAPPVVIPNTPEGDRVIIYVTGGKVEGPRINGKLLPGGGDWLTIRSDGVGTLDVRAVIQTDDGENIYIIYRGIAKLPAGGLGAGVTFPIRMAPSFLVSKSSKYAWLNSVQAVGEGAPTRAGVTYQIYEVK